MHIILIGNGIAGVTAARQLRKRGAARITMISDESWQPFSRTALMYLYMGHLKLEHTYLYEDWFWAKNRIERVMGRVSRVDVRASQVILSDGAALPYDRLVIATGSRPNRFGWPGQDLDGVQGLYHLQDLDRLERLSAALAPAGDLPQERKRAVIVGGGLIGVEMAEMFHARRIPVTFLVREKGFWDIALPPEESAAVGRHIQAQGIDLRLETALRAIEGDAQGRAAAVITHSGEQIPCGFVGLTAGVSPNVDFLRDSGLELGRGVLVDDYLESSQPGVYAIGDCAELRTPAPGRRSIEAVWYTARAMGETVAATIAGEKTAYRPGHWFNSAKFFEIEYQVYGDVPPQAPPHTRSLYWAHPDGRKSIRINYDAASRAVTGFLVLGIRYRQAVCERWIGDKTPIETVLARLEQANFDPEFYRRHESAVRAAFTLS